MPNSNKRQVCWRARRLTDKKMLYGQLVIFDHQGWLYENMNDKYQVDISTKGMSIGITDKNGQEVYEGDLILAADNGIQDVYIVVYRGCGFVGKHYSSESYIDLITHEIEVVGMYYSSNLEQDLLSIKSKLNKLLQGDKTDVKT